MAAAIGIQYAVDLPGLPEREQLQQWARAALDAAGVDGALAVRVVDESESAALNERWRGKQGATNVLSFAFAMPNDLPVRELGDIVICAPVVAREAAMQGKATDAHWAHMVTHGVLHLLGHDHENEADAERMETLETRILEALGYPDPYTVD